LVIREGMPKILGGVIVNRLPDSELPYRMTYRDRICYLGTKRVKAIPNLIHCNRA